jgi:WhiB family redox-sensing transcriptional regulator
LRDIAAGIINPRELPESAELLSRSDGLPTGAGAVVHVTGGRRPQTAA